MFVHGERQQEGRDGTGGEGVGGTEQLPASFGVPRSDMPSDTTKREQSDGRLRTHRRGRVGTWLMVVFGAFASTWVLGIALVLLLLLALALGQETYRKYQITTEIQEQRAAIARLERSNRELDDLVHYLQTDSYRERVARERLGLKREGEEVVVVPESASEPVTFSARVDVPRSNPGKWWAYFFSQDVDSYGYE